jgi:hypothetical protein
MTTPSYCVNGCTDTRIDDSDCLCRCHGHGEAHRPECTVAGGCGSSHPAKRIRRETRHGLLCNTCTKKLRGILEDIGPLYAMLDLAVTPSRTGDGSGPGNFAENPVPLNLGAAALRDARAAKLPNMAVRDPDEYEPWEEVHDVPNTLAIVSNWAQCLRDDLHPAGVAPPKMRLRAVTLTETPGGSRWVHDILVREVAPVTVLSEIRTLANGFDRLVERAWVDEAMRELSALRRALLAAHGMQATRPIGKCYVLTGTSSIECGGNVYEKADGSLRCMKCEERWTGRAVVRYRLVSGNVGG